MSIIACFLLYNEILITVPIGVIWKTSLDKNKENKKQNPACPSACICLFWQQKIVAMITTKVTITKILNKSMKEQN